MKCNLQRKGQEQEGEVPKKSEQEGGKVRGGRR